MKIIVIFAGGPLDGKRVIGEDGQQSEAERYYALSYHGRVGQSFRTASEYAVNLLTASRLKDCALHGFQQHRYEIVHRRETGDTLLLRARYLQESVVRE